ncbi:hypothetical protein NKH18_50350 [Streptomyces sp. M10(2022)]
MSAGTLGLPLVGALQQRAGPVVAFGVTYYDDGFGFLVPSRRTQPSVREMSDLCGLLGVFTLYVTVLCLLSAVAAPTMRKTRGIDLAGMK